MKPMNDEISVGREGESSRKLQSPLYGLWPLPVTLCLSCMHANPPNTSCVQERHSVLSNRRLY
jgi:hypothetical protein